jgi:hypothetical protein
VQKYGVFLIKKVRDLATRKLEKLFLCPLSKSISALVTKFDLKKKTLLQGPSLM